MLQNLDSETDNKFKKLWTTVHKGVNISIRFSTALGGVAAPTGTNTALIILSIYDE
jgi:hypothetical protein